MIECFTLFIFFTIDAFINRLCYFLVSYSLEAKFSSELFFQSLRMMMNSTKKSVLLALIFSSLLTACAVDVAKRPNLNSNYKAKPSIEVIYSTKQKAYSARGISQQHLDNISYPRVVKPSRLSKPEIRSIIDRGHVSDIEIILGLPSDANFFALEQQNNLWKKGSYLTIENKEKLLFTEANNGEKSHAIDTTEVKMRTETYKNKAKKIIIKS